MKKAIFTILFAFISLLSFGQISGGFFYGSDYEGNVFVYFKGTNISQHTVQIKIKSINELLDQEVSWDCNLASGNNFTVGPSDNWIWQSGEKLIITYPNGASYYWVYAPFNISTSTEQNKVCYTCHGHGRCVVCGGSGIYSAYGYSSTCSACEGTGKCWHCHGSGIQ